MRTRTWDTQVRGLRRRLPVRSPYYVFEQFIMHSVLRYPFRNIWSQMRRAVRELDSCHAVGAIGAIGAIDAMDAIDAIDTNGGLFVHGDGRR